jgi:hypothetical protein
LFNSHASLCLSLSLSLFSSDNLASLINDVKAAKWLDPSTTDLGLVKFPEIGVRRAEIITAMCGMLHGPLSKIQPETYAG